MKAKPLLIVLLLLLTRAGFAQFGFNKVYHLNSCCGEVLQCLIVDNDTIVALRTGFDENVNNWGVSLLKIDTFGNIIQSAFLSDSVEQFLLIRGRSHIISTQDGGYAFLSHVVNTPYCNTSSNCLAFAKFNHNLELEILRYYDAPKPNYYFAGVQISLTRAEDGFFFVTNYQPEESFNSDESALYRTDLTGQVEWVKVFDAVDTAYIVHYIEEEFDGTIKAVTSKGLFDEYNYEISGTFGILTLDSIGNVLNETWFPGEDYTFFNIISDGDGGYIQGGIKYVADSIWVQRYKPFVRKIDSNYEEVWRQYADVPVEEVAPFDLVSWYWEMKRIKQGQYVTVGFVGLYEDSTKSGTGLMTRFNSEGEVLWERYFRGSSGDSKGGDDELRGVAILSSGSIVAAGKTFIEEPNGWSDKSWLIKVTPGGCLTASDSLTMDCWPKISGTSEVKLPDILMYPNPINSELVVFLPDGYKEVLRMDFYDVAGRHLKAEGLRPGFNSVQVGHLPAGMLLYTIRAADRIIQRGKVVKQQ